MKKIGTHLTDLHHREEMIHHCHQ